MDTGKGRGSLQRRLETDNCSELYSFSNQISLQGAVVVLQLEVGTHRVLFKQD